MNRSFTARLSAKTPRRLRDYLWATHRIFNESLAYVLKHYFWMQNLNDRTAEQDRRNRLRNRFDDAQLDRLRMIYRDMMGLDLPKEKRAGRSQSAHAWMEPITFSTESKGSGPGESSKNLLPQVKEAIRQIRRRNTWLFDRELAFPLSPNKGFRRGLFEAAARRILNFEQNQDTHKSYLEEARSQYERWTGGEQRDVTDEEGADERRAGWRRTVLLRAWGKEQNAQREAEIDEIARLNWSDFERARVAFEAYEQERSEKRAREHGQQFDGTKVERINAAMTRGWRDIYERLMPPDAQGAPDRTTAEEVIKGYQMSEPRRIGDVNFFLWLADKPHLWRYVDTMRAYNTHQRKLQQYAKDIQFRYPRYNVRPDWFTFSETSPGYMYTIVSMSPLVVELSVLVPKEDEPILKKHAKGKPLTEDEQARLSQPIDWSTYHLTREALANRLDRYREDLTKKHADLIAKANLGPVHDWTNGMWQQLLDGFFRGDPPLDMARFTRVMVRYALSTDRRLRPFVPQPSEDSDLIGRLEVLSNERKKRHYQGTYEYWFGPLAEARGLLVERRRYLRRIPLTVGGIRLEYRGRLRSDAEPIFTLSCELDERLNGPEGKRVFPAPAHRIPPKSDTAETAEGSAASAANKRRISKKRPKMPVGLRVMAVDLGLRHPGTGAVVEFVDDGHGHGRLPEPLKPVAVEILDVAGTSLVHIQRHQDERRRKQKKACPRGSRRRFEIRGAHLAHGQEFARGLLNHVENLKDDRRKKAAHTILRAALKHKVDYIVFENLAGYRPEMEFGRKVNAALMTWNRRELVEFVKMEAAPLGIHVYEWVPPHHTSRFCHRCGAVGHRFSHIRSIDAKKDALAPAEPLLDNAGNPKLDSYGKPILRRKWTPQARRVRGTPLGLIAGMRQAIDGGRQFCCTECGLIVNADYNAAMNLARKLADEFHAYQRYAYDREKRTWTVNGETLPGRDFWERAKALVQQRLNQRFRQPPETPPAGGWPRSLEPSPIEPTPW